MQTQLLQMTTQQMHIALLHSVNDYMHFTHLLKFDRGGSIMYFFLFLSSIFKTADAQKLCGGFC